MSIHELINTAKQNGFSVFAPENITSYFYVYKDNKIGYCQIDRLEGIKYSTVHKPCTQCGTGFAVNNLEETIIFAPYWAGNLVNNVIKYKSKDEFIKNNWQKLIDY